MAKWIYKQIELDQMEGLTDAQVQAMRRKFGRNELTPPKRKPWWKDLFEKFEDPTILILIASAVLALGIASVEKWVLHSPEASFLDTIGIFVAIGLATLVGFFSERKSAREFELLNKVKDDITVKVLRNDQLTELHIGEVVVGDLIKLTIGDKIPADGVFVEVSNLKIEQSMMTGESLPVKKIACSEDINLEDPEAIENLNKLTNSSFAARGTMVADGSGWLRVTAVGDETQMGKIASALAEDSYENETPLTQKLTRLAKTISAVGVAAALMIFTVMSVQACIIAINEKEIASTILNTKAVYLQFGLVILGALFLGFLVVRFLLKPFFQSMDLEMNSAWKRFFCFVPIAGVSFVLLLAVGEMIEYAPGTPQFQIGLDLLQSVLLSFVVAVTIIVVAVPEGLPMMVTVSLALNMMKMARENCLVRKLVASETIGSATVICTDKTGTLTQNQMTPVWGVLGTTEFPNADAMAKISENANWDQLVKGICINSTADLHVEVGLDDSKTVTGIGNPTECAFLKFVYGMEIAYKMIRYKFPFQDVLEHNSQRKMSAVKVLDGEKSRVYLKGASERILFRCSTILCDGTVQPITEEIQVQLENMVADASARGLRLLAFAEVTLPEDGHLNDVSLETLIEDEPYSEFTLIGILGIADPMRPEVPHAVARCRKAGIVVKMVTGDSLPTARAIAKDAGIYTGSESELVMTSEEFNEIPDEELPEKAKALRVLARSSPADKLRLVMALHEDGEVVAMTGDGTNDAPALKFADVGLSMGKTGTEVAKEASDIVLMTDDFKNIVTGVCWGRTLYQNIQRFLQFQLSVNAAALLCAVIGPCVGVPLPLTVTQLLWINIIMDTFAAIAYSTQPPRANVLDQPPIHRNASIITPEMMLNIVIVSIYQTSILFASLFGGWFVTKNADGSFDPQSLESLTIFFTTLVMFQFWHKFNCRSLSGHESAFCDLFKCRGFLAIVCLITVTQIVLVQCQEVGVFFRTQPLQAIQWLQITALTSTVLVVGWITRKLSLLFS